MKDYLQMDGLAYKLVPIKTQNRSPYELGRIDSELMYDIVMNWDWGNSGSTEIYHDPQTRTQGLSYRGNLARLMETLINENKIDKAKDIINLSMENMPVDYYGYYTFVEPFLDGYYKVGETQKGRALFDQLKKKYQERLDFYAGAPLDEQYRYLDNILSDMEGYQRNINILIQNKDREFVEKETLIFNSYIDKFEHFMGDDNPFEEDIEETPVPIDSAPEVVLDTLLDDSIQ